jgi:hypothetical protein
MSISRLDFTIKINFFMVKSSLTRKKTSKNAIFPLFDDFVKKSQKFIFFTIFRLFLDKKHSKTF